MVISTFIENDSRVTFVMTLPCAHRQNKMLRYTGVYIVCLTLSLFPFILYLIQISEDGHEKQLHLNMIPELEEQLDTDQDRRCEAKIHTSPVPFKLKIRQYARKKRVRDLCRSSGAININGTWQIFDKIPISYLSDLFVDNRHEIIYCSVPKVGCTTWKRIMIFLSESLKVHGVPYRKPEDLKDGIIHEAPLPRLSAYPREVINKKLQTFKKFLFVRDPFVRLISAYRDKFLKLNQLYYQRVAVGLLRKYGNVSNPPESVQEAHASGMIPSFNNFIQYILSLPVKNGDAFDIHWRQTVHLCHPCLIDYDFIGKMETLREDAEQLLRILHVDNIVSIRPQRGGKTEQSEIKNWFYNITVEDRRKLYKTYEEDFRLFGYKNHENLDNIDPPTIT